MILILNFHQYEDPKLETKSGEGQGAVLARKDTGKVVVLGKYVLGSAIGINYSWTVKEPFRKYFRGRTDLVKL